MEKQKAEQFKTLLNNQLIAIQEEINSTVKHMSHDDEVYADPTDVASAETDKAMQLKIRDRERLLLTKISDALRRIEDGTFGLCEVCEEPITEARLKARPVTTLCIDCKAEAEAIEHKSRYTM